MEMEWLECEERGEKIDFPSCANYTTNNTTSSGDVVVG